MLNSAANPLPPKERLSRFVERHEIKVVVGLVLLGLGVRLLHFFQIEARDPFFYHPAVDPAVYHAWASRIAAGNWMGDEAFFLAPLYPYTLAILYKLVGPTLYGARLAQLVLGAGNVFLVYLLGKRTLSPAAGALGAFIWALYSMSIFYDGILLVTAVQTPLNLLFALALTGCASRPTPLRFALAGGVLGLSVLARPNVLLMIPVILFWIYLRARKNAPTYKRGVAINALAFVGAVAVVVAPVTVRNQIVADDFILVSAQGGANFYIGNGPGATGVFRVPADFPPTRADDPDQQRQAYAKIAQEDVGETLKPSQVSRYWWERTVDHIREHPGTFAVLTLKKLGLFFNEHESGNSRDYPSSRQFSGVLSAPLPTFGLICPLALLGMIVSWRTRRRAAFPLYALIAIYAISLTMFFVLSHYRMPVVPFFVLFAAGGLLWLLDRAEQKRIVAVGLAVVFLGAAAAVTHIDLVDETGHRFIVHYNLANKWRMLEDRQKAVDAYEQSIALNPDYISSHNNLAMMIDGDPAQRDRAITAWQAVLRLGKQYRDSRYVERATQRLHRLGVKSEPGPDR